MMHQHHDQHAVLWLMQHGCLRRTVHLAARKSWTLRILDFGGVTERVRSPCVGHVLGFWVPIEIKGRSLVRWKATR